MVNTPLRILVVDDELLVRWSAAEMLGAAGHHVVQASDARSTMEVLRTMGDVDVVLLDYRLPDSNDLTLLGKIRRAAPGAAVVMMTAHGTPEMEHAAMALGAQQVMAKPFDMLELDAVVRQAFAARAH